MHQAIGGISLKTVMLTLLILLTGTSVFASYKPGIVYNPIHVGKLSGSLTVIDAGHGGDDPGCCWIFRGKHCMEAAYTYKMAAELGTFIRQIGGAVAFTVSSKNMSRATSTKDALPKPTDAISWTGNRVHASKIDRLRRTALNNKLLVKYHTRYKLFSFVSLHIDAMGQPIWKGLHVCYDKHRQSGAPRLAKLMANAVENNGYQRMKRICITKITKGKFKIVKVWCEVRPLDSRRLDVLNGKNNCLKHRVLLECGIPNNDSDSWRLRSAIARQRMLKRCVIQPLINLMSEKPWIKT